MHLSEYWFTSMPGKFISSLLAGYASDVVPKIVELLLESYWPILISQVKPCMMQCVEY